MSCEICARDFCSRDYHTEDEIELFDSIAIRVKETMRYRLEQQVNNLPIEDDTHVKLIDVIAIISDYD